MANCGVNQSFYFQRQKHRVKRLRIYHLMWTLFFNFYCLTCWEFFICDSQPLQGFFSSSVSVRAVYWAVRQHGLQILKESLQQQPAHHSKYVTWPISIEGIAPGNIPKVLQVKCIDITRTTLKFYQCSYKAQGDLLGQISDMALIMSEDVVSSILLVINIASS